MIKILILDFDGTLGDTQTLILNTMQKTIKQLGLPSRTREQCKQMIGLPLKQTFTDLISMTDEMGDTCVRVYREIFDEDNTPGVVPLFPNVLQTLHLLHQKGYELTIASSRASQSLQGFVRDLKLEQCISLVMSCEDVKNAKPDPEMVCKTLNITGHAPEEAIVIGDTKYDILMGKNANCTTIGVTYGNGSREEMEEAGADFIIDDFADVFTCLEKMELDDSLNNINNAQC